MEMVYLSYSQGGNIAATTTYVDYRTEDGTANAGSDFEFTTGTLIFQPGESERHIEIKIIDDDVFEEDEHFFVNLSNARNEGDDETSEGKYRVTGASLTTATAFRRGILHLH